MKKDDLLAEVGRAVAAEEADQEASAPLDPRLERLAIGDLSHDEVSTLERDGSRDPVLAAQIELFRPLARPERVRDAALDAYLVRRPKRAPRTVTSIVRVAAPLMAAAAAILFFVRARPIDLPAYDARVTSADVRERGAHAAAIDAIQSGPEFEMVLRPDHAPRPPVAARAFVRKDGALDIWRGTFDVSTDGAIRLNGATSELFGPGPRETDVIVAIGDGDALPKDPTQMQNVITSESAPTRFRVISQHVRLVPPATP